MTNTQAIKSFLEANGGRKVSLDEMKKLSNEERAELGALCATELGETITATPVKL